MSLEFKSDNGSDHKVEIPEETYKPYYQRQKNFRVVEDEGYDIWVTEQPYYVFNHLGNKVIADYYNAKHFSKSQRKIIATESNEDFENKLVDFVQNSDADMIGLTARSIDHKNAHLTPIVVEKKDGKNHLFISDSIGTHSALILKTILSIRKKYNLPIKIHLTKTNLPNEKCSWDNNRQASNGPCFSDCFYYLQRALRMESLVDHTECSPLPKNDKIIASCYNNIYFLDKKRAVFVADSYEEFKLQLQRDFINGFRYDVGGFSVRNSTNLALPCVPVIFEKTYIDKNNYVLHVYLSDSSGLFSINEAVLKEIEQICKDKKIPLEAHKIKMNLPNDKPNDSDDDENDDKSPHSSVIQYLQRALRSKNFAEGIDEEVDDEGLDFNTFNEPADLALTAEISGFLKQNSVTDKSTLSVNPEKQKTFLDKAGTKQDVTRYKQDTVDQEVITGEEQTFQERTFLVDINQKHGKIVEEHIRKNCMEHQLKENTTLDPYYTTYKHVQLVKYFEEKWSNAINTANPTNDQGAECIIALLKSYSKYGKISIYRLTRNHVDDVDKIIKEYYQSPCNAEDLMKKLPSLKNTEGTLAALMHFANEKLNNVNPTPLAVGKVAPVENNSDLSINGNPVKYYAYGKR